MADDAAHAALAALRRRLRARRRALAGSDQSRHSLAICRHLWCSALPLRGWIAAYAPFDGEPALWPFIARHPRCALPVVASATRITFRAHRHGDRLRRNRFAIAEPVGGAPVSPRRLAAVLVPLVAFDGAGRRLGMGGGHYDRRFAAAPRPVLVGIAHALQRVERLPSRSWDVPLDAVVTEAGWCCFTARGRNVLRLY